MVARRTHPKTVEAVEDLPHHYPEGAVGMIPRMVARRSMGYIPQMVVDQHSTDCIPRTMVGQTMTKVAVGHYTLRKLTTWTLTGHNLHYRSMVGRGCCCTLLHQVVEVRCTLPKVGMGCIPLAVEMQCTPLKVAQMVLHLVEEGHCGS